MKFFMMLNFSLLTKRVLDKSFRLREKIDFGFIFIHKLCLKKREGIFESLDC